MGPHKYLLSCMAWNTEGEGREQAWGAGVGGQMATHKRTTTASGTQILSAQLSACRVRWKCYLVSILNRADFCTGFLGKILSRERGNTHGF